MGWKPFKILTLYDIIVVVLVLSITAVWLGWGSVLHSASSGNTVIVEIQGEEIFRQSMSRFKEKKFHLEAEDIEFTLHIRDNQVRILPMDDHFCPRHICSATGWISNPFETIVCIPNEMMISIEGAQKSDERPVDALVY